MTCSYILRKKKNMQSRARNHPKTQRVEIVEPTATILNRKINKSTIWRLFEFAGIIAALVGLGVAIADNRVAQESLRLAREENKQSQIVQSWQILISKASGNSGKREALENLNREGQSLMGIDLSCDIKELLNAGKAEEHCERPTYLAYTDLRKSDLSNANFSWAIMDTANLVESNLNLTNFKHTWLWHANMARSDLTLANLEHAQIQNANLTGAHLFGSRVENAIFTGTNVSSAQFCGIEVGSYLCPFGIDQQQIDSMWAWRDQPPGYQVGNMTFGYEMPKLCDPALRPEYEKSQKFGIPKGCK